MEVTGQRARPTGVRRAFFRAPIWLYRLHLGRVMGQRFLLIHHIGRVSGRPRQTVVEVVSRDPVNGAITVASGFGEKSDWFLNVLAHPDVTLELGGNRLDVTATRLSPDEAGAAMADYARRHPKAGRELCRYMGMSVDGSPADFVAAGRLIPMLRFDPVEQF